jgi:hypothetical protein
MFRNWILLPSSGKKEASSTRGQQIGFMSFFSFLPEDGSRIQLSKRCNFTFETIDKVKIATQHHENF